MKVEELIKKLQAMPQNAKVVVSSGYDYDGYDEVETVTIVKIKRVKYEDKEYVNSNRPSASMAVWITDL